MQWALRGVAPTLEVFTNRSNRHEKTTALADQFSHRITRPERKAELELVGHLIGHQGANQHFLAGAQTAAITLAHRSEEHTSELQSLMRNSYAVFCLKKKKN